MAVVVPVVAWPPQLAADSHFVLDAPNPLYGSFAGPFPVAGVALANNTGPYTVRVSLGILLAFSCSVFVLGAALVCFVFSLAATCTLLSSR